MWVLVVIVAVVIATLVGHVIAHPDLPSIAGLAVLAFGFAIVAWTEFERYRDERRWPRQ